MTAQTTPKIENYTPSGGVAIDSENQLFDIRTLLTSGNVVASITTAIGQSPIIGTATHPKIENLTPVPGKFIDKDNNIIDLLTLFTNGDLKITVSGIAPGVLPQSFLTALDETATLPNSIPLILQDTGFLMVENGTGDIRTRLITGSANEITVNDGDGVNDDPLIRLATDLRLPGTLLASDDVTFNPNVGNTNNFHCNTRSFFNLASQFSGGIFLNSNAGITANTGYNLPIKCVDSDKSVQLLSTVEVEGIIARNTQTTNNITFGNATQDFKIGGVSMLNISASGLLAGGVINTGGFNIVSPFNVKLRLAPGNTALTWIELWADTVNVKKAFIFDSTMTHNMTYYANALYFHLENTQSLKLNSAGITLTTGSTVNNISNNPSAMLATQLMTAEATQIAIANGAASVQSFRGGYDASTNVYPSTGGTGVGGVPMAGNVWIITTAGTLGTRDVSEGDTLIALVDTPGQTSTNWSINANGVAKFNGRGGIVWPESGDYSFSLISGNIATSQLPNSGVNGNSQLVQLNGSGQLPALSGVNLTGLTGTLTSSANNLNVAVNGGTASANVSIVNSISLGLSGTALTSTVNGQTSSAVQVQPATTFNTVTTSTHSLTVNSVNYTTYAGLCVMPLPVTSEVGEKVTVISGASGSTFKVAQNAGQQCLFGSQDGVSVATTSGVGGHIQSISPNTTAEFICVVANTTWLLTSSVNNLDVT
jgi:hypothetical protein